jgi:hypothetical protein
LNSASALGDDVAPSVPRGKRVQAPMQELPQEHERDNRDDEAVGDSDEWA